MRRIDLHVHSTASDGDHPPDDVARRAAAAGLSAIALTDHDTVAGVAAAQAEGAVLGVRVVAGCEFSVRAPWGEMHLLAYFLPLDHPELEAFLRSQRDARTARMDEIVRRLQAAHLTLTRADVTRHAAGGAEGRPHAARALLAAGVVPDVQTAFDRYLGSGRPAFVPKRLPDLDEVTALVRRIGGVTSAAHLKDRGGRGALDVLREQGVDAVESRHPSHDEATVARLERAAAELAMPCTGGSDWHGDARPLAARRAPLGALDVPPAWLDALEDLHHHRRPVEAPS